MEEIQPIKVTSTSSPKLLTAPEALSHKDRWLGFLAGLLIGLMAMPVLKAAQPDIYLKLRLAIIPFFVIGTPLGLYVAHLIAKKISVVWQLAKFGVTGVINVLVDFGILSILIIIFKKYLTINSTDILFSLGIAITFYSLFKAVSFIVANINSYLWNKYWTFDKQGNNQSEFFQFFIVSIVGFVINVVVASIVFKSIPPVGGLNFDQWALIGAAIGSIVGLAWNFLGYKFIVFKK